MKKASLRLQFILSMIFLFCVVFILPLWWHHNYCSASISSNQINTADQSQAEQNASVNQAPIPHAPQPRAANKATQNGKEGGQIHPWICDYHLTDVLLLYFTSCLVVIGYFTMMSADKAVKDTERAIMFGGPSLPPIGMVGAKSLPNYLAIGMGVTNYGKTIAVLKEMRVEFSQSEPLGTVAVYNCDDFNVTKYDTGFLPNTSGQPNFIGYGYTAIKGPQFCYGFIKYMDIFRETHMSRFCCKIDPTFVGMIEVSGSDAYNEWD